LAGRKGCWRGASIPPSLHRTQPAGAISSRVLQIWRELDDTSAESVRRIVRSIAKCGIDVRQAVVGPRVLAERVGGIARELVMQKREA